MASGRAATLKGSSIAPAMVFDHWSLEVKTPWPRRAKVKSHSRETQSLWSVPSSRRAIDRPTSSAWEPAWRSCTLADTAGKARLFNVVPSLDTPVCNTQTKRFAQELKALGDKVEAYTVSLDLPFAQGRFCTEAAIENLKNLSDVHNHSFGEHYGVLISDLPLPLLARAVFVVNPSNTITYVEVVPEIVQEPNYEPAIAALKEAAK